jgi:uncharacterized protein YegJ (DUF2314 family)
MGMWSRFRSWFSRRPDDRPMVSLVVLLREPRALSVAGLADAIRRAHGLEVWAGVDEPRGEYYILEEANASFILQLGPRTFRVNNAAVTYLANANANAVEIPELRLRRAVAEHRAWLSVDLLPGRPNRGTQIHDEIHAAYRLIGPLVAELSAHNALVLLEPDTGRMNAYGPHLDRELRGPDPRHALVGTEFAPVVAIKDDDPRMIAAVAEARERWLEFVGAFEARRPDQVFSVKVRLAEGRAVEFMWLSVSALEGDYLYGSLDNEPVGLRKLRLGSRIRSRVDEINDWTYLDGGAFRGGFTIDVLRKANERQG